MLYTLENDLLKISVNSLGAELWHIICNQTGTDYLWQGRECIANFNNDARPLPESTPLFWQGRSPILFPIVGRLKNGTCNYYGKKMNIDLHGFAQTNEFDVASEPGKLIFSLKDNPVTRQIYPFEFMLKVIFTLENNRLCTEYCVSNTSDTVDLVFGIGGHPGFVLPHTQFSDYFLEFENCSHISSTVVSPNGLLEDDTSRIDLIDSRLPLSYELFSKYDTILLVDTPVKKVSLKSMQHKNGITVGFDAEHLAIWAQQGAPFVCLEPWDGLPDFESTCGDFAKKVGNHILPPGASKTFTNYITIGI